MNRGNDAHLLTDENRKLYKLRNGKCTVKDKARNFQWSGDSVNFIENTIRLFEISNERTCKMIDSYDDIDAFISILNEKTSDVNQISQICKFLLEKNQDLNKELEVVRYQHQDDQIQIKYLEGRIKSLKEFIESNNDEFFEGKISHEISSQEVAELKSENSRLRSLIDDLRAQSSFESALIPSPDSVVSWRDIYVDMNSRIDQLETENQTLKQQIEYFENEDYTCYKIDELGGKKNINENVFCSTCGENISRYEENEEIMKQTISELSGVIEDYKAQLSTAYNKISRFENSAEFPNLIVDDDFVSEPKSLQLEMDELNVKTDNIPPKASQLTSKNRILRQIETANIIKNAKKSLRKSSIYMPFENGPHVCEFQAEESHSIITLSGGENMFIGASSNTRGIRHRSIASTVVPEGVLEPFACASNKSQSGGSSKGSSHEGKQALTIVKPVAGSFTMASWKRLATPGMSSLLGTPPQGVISRLMSGTPTKPNK